MALFASRSALRTVPSTAQCRFNGFARKLDERLRALGATALEPRHEADTDHEDDSPGWENRTFALLAAE